MKKKLLIVVTLCTLTTIIGYELPHHASPLSTGLKTKIIRASQNGYINPLLEYEISDKLYGGELKNFDEEIGTLVKQKIKSGQAQEVSVYFRSLNNGPWFGINQDVHYFPASLLKVPVMLTFLKLADTDSTILKKKITYNQSDKDLIDFDNPLYFKPKETIKVEETYTVEELLKKMIIYSDNLSKNLLILNLPDTDKLLHVYTDLGLISEPELNSQKDSLSVHDYATFYRILYNATYLSKDMSKMALALLVRSDFKDGLGAKLPINIEIAHKFGEYAHDTVKQLHDCGIVYYPKSPYILCIMTRGSSFPDLEQTIQDISFTVYKHIDTQSNPN